MELAIDKSTHITEKPEIVTAKALFTRYTEMNSNRSEVIRDLVGNIKNGSKGMMEIAGMFKLVRETAQSDEDRRNEESKLRVFIRRACEDHKVKLVTAKWNKKEQSYVVQSVKKHVNTNVVTTMSNKNISTQAKKLGKTIKSLAPKEQLPLINLFLENAGYKLAGAKSLKKV